MYQSTHPYAVDGSTEAERGAGTVSEDSVRPKRIFIASRSSDSKGTVERTPFRVCSDVGFIAS